MNLFETYFAGRKFGNRYVELFTNPSKSELFEVTEKSFRKNKKREIRFAINPENKTIFVCDSYIGLHPDIRSLTNYTEDDFFIIYGLATYNGTKFIVNLDECYSEIFSLFLSPKYQDVTDRFLNFDWNWVSVYVDGIEQYIKKIKFLKNKKLSN